MDTRKQTYDVLQEPVGITYRELINFSLGFCSSFLLVVRPYNGLSSLAEDVLDGLAPVLLSKEESSHWPGTTLLGHTAVVHRFRLTAETAAVLAGVSDGLYSWLQPQLPEDPCLLRPDGGVWLATIAHEEDSYMELTVGEAAALATGVPGLQLRLRQS